MLQPDFSRLLSERQPRVTSQVQIDIKERKKKKKTKVRRNCANGEYMVKFWSKDEAFSNEIGIESRLIGRVVGHARGTRSRRSISKRDQWKRRPKRT